jgi:hypothetical protein
MVIWTCIYKAVQLKSKLTHWNLIGRSVTAPQPVLSPSSIPPHLRLIALPLPREKFGALLESVTFFFITENLRTSESVRKLDVHESVNRDTIMKMTKKMHLLTFLLHGAESFLRS